MHIFFTPARPHCFAQMDLLDAEKKQVLKGLQHVHLANPPYILRWASFVCDCRSLAGNHAPTSTQVHAHTPAHLSSVWWGALSKS